MKKLVVFTVAIVMSGIFAIQAADLKAEDDPAVRSELAARLLECMEVGKALNQSFDAIKKMQGEMTKRLIKNAKDQKIAIKRQHEIMDLMKKELSWKNLKPEFEKLYAETYSTEELKGLIKFYQGPIGKKFIEKQPEMQLKSMAMVQKIVMRIMPRIQALTKKMQKEIIAAKKAGATSKRSIMMNMIKTENYFYASQGYMVGKFIAKNIPGAKVLLIENESFKKSKRETGFIAALKKGMGSDRVNAIALGILNKPERPKDMPKDMPMMPMVEMMTSKDFDATLSANSSDNVVISVIGLPRDASKMKLWRMPKAKRPKLILIGGGMNGPIKLAPAIKRGMITAVVIISPRAQFDDQGAPPNFDDAFKKRYILIDKDNLANNYKSLR